VAGSTSISFFIYVAYPKYHLGFFLSLNVPLDTPCTSESSRVYFNQLGLFLVSGITIGCIGSLGPSYSWFDSSSSLVALSSNTRIYSSSESLGRSFDFLNVIVSSGITYQLTSIWCPSFV